LKLAIVILNWNGKTLLETFLPSVIEHSSDHDIYVVDNASTDKSIEFLESKHPSINCIKLSENIGYAAGYNESLKQINADVYCLLNSDIEVTKNWLTSVIDIFQTEADTHIVQPKILDYNKKNYFEYAGAGGGFIDQLGYPYCRGRIFDCVEEDKGQYDDRTEIFWASGACLFIRASSFKALKGFDNTFFAHMEEIDLCWRAKNKGFKIEYTGASTVYHIGGASLNNSNPKKTYLNFRNSLYALVKNSQNQLIIVVYLRLVLDGLAGLRFLFQGKFKHIIAIIKAHGSFYRALPQLIKLREQTIKTTPIKDLLPSIVWSHFILKVKHYNKIHK
jgi:GT2 family glycosyltransferase|tara:strand:+ start:5600 stop:6598 length:999 start_codon:yes stop_codon:yes gene_type:complete